MARKRLDKDDSPIRRLVSGDRRTPTPTAKAVGNIFLVLAILLIGIGAIAGFVVSVKEPTEPTAATTVSAATATDTQPTSIETTTAAAEPTETTGVTTETTASATETTVATQAS